MHRATLFFRTFSKSHTVSCASLKLETRHLELSLAHNVLHINIILPSKLRLISRLLSFNRLYYFQGNCLLVKNIKKSKHAQVNSIPNLNSYVWSCRPTREF